MDRPLTARPALRLVTERDPQPRPVSRPRHTPSENIARANRAASELSPADARWAFALRVSRSLDAPTGTLPPATRDRLVTTAKALGLRPFDANLIIAIVQDGVRTGAGPLAPSVQDRLGLVRQANSEPRRPSIALHVASAVLLAAVLCFGLIRLVLA